MLVGMLLVQAARAVVVALKARAGSSHDYREVYKMGLHMFRHWTLVGMMAVLGTVAGVLSNLVQSR